MTVPHLKKRAKVISWEIRVIEPKHNHRIAIKGTGFSLSDQEQPIFYDRVLLQSETIKHHPVEPRAGRRVAVGKESFRVERDFQP